MQSLVRQRFPLTFHNREMCTAFEAMKDPNTCINLGHVNTATHHNVSIHLRSRHTDWHTKLDCAILSNDTGTTPPSKFDTSSWKIPKDIKLEDEQFDQPGSTDILIVAEILRSGKRTRPDNFPVLQGTVLVEIQLSPHRMTQAYISATRRQQSGAQFKPLLGGGTVEQSTMTAEEQACEEHSLSLSHTHTHTNIQMSDLWLDFKSNWNPINFEIRLSAERRLHVIKGRLERDPEL